MMKTILLIIAFVMFGLFKTKAASEEQFWKWFQSNEVMLFSFEKNQDEVFGKLSDQMRKLHKSLTFEFGPVSDGKREFVISADGIKEAFPIVERLHATAPKLNRWVFIKFRPRRVPFDLEFKGVKVSASDVFCTIESDRGKIGITVFLKGYKTEHQSVYPGITFLMLDQALGEFDVETKVGFIETKSFEEPSALEKKPLADLPKAFDAFWNQQLEESQPKTPTDRNAPRQ